VVVVSDKKKFWVWKVKSGGSGREKGRKAEKESLGLAD